MSHSTVVKADDATMLLSKRSFHDDKDSTYWLPKDKDEKNRLIKVRYQSFLFYAEARKLT